MSRPKTKPKAKKRAPAKTQERSFSEILSAVNADGWVSSGLTMDAEVFQTVFGMRAAMRDAWRTNPYIGKYAEQIAANVFGESGIMLRSKVKETEDRVVYAPDDATDEQKARVAREKWALIQHERRIERIRLWAEKKTRQRIEQYRAFKLADSLEKRDVETIIRGKALIEVGAPDVYANQRIEAGWAEWQRAENCDVRGRRTYNMLRQIRLWSAARDGGHFIRLIRDSTVNRFGFAIQHVNDEWCDHFFNTTLDNGNIVRMGIEYPMTAWGIGKPVNFHFIKRIPRDWQTSARYGGHAHAQRDAVPAGEIIHYARFQDTESTRPAPWGVSILGKIRHLDQYEIAAVVAARAEACKTGWLYSDLVPEGGVLPEMVKNIGDNAKAIANSIRISPGGLYGLPYGVKFQANNPTHPSGNFSTFRQGMGQATCSGLPGADYNVIFNDLNMSFSSGRIGRLDTNEVSKMLQRWDIETAERPIFEAWLEMALITGAIDLPFSPSKYRKFNRAQFQGRRWSQVSEIDAANAAALRVANHISSLSRENAEAGNDFEDVMIERAEEIMLQESLGINPAFTVQQTVTSQQDKELALEATAAAAAAKPKEPPADDDADEGEKAHLNGNRIPQNALEAN